MNGCGTLSMTYKEWSELREMVVEELRCIAYADPEDYEGMSSRTPDMLAPLSPSQWRAIRSIGPNGVQLHSRKRALATLNRIRK